MPMKESEIVPKRQLLPPPPVGTMQEGGSNRGLGTDDGIHRGFGLGTLHRQEVGSSIVALNLQAERLRAVGHD